MGAGFSEPYNLENKCLMNVINPRSVLFFSILVLAASCRDFVGERGNGVIVTEEVAVEDFEKLEVSGSFYISLVRSARPGFVITTDENLMDLIEVRNKGNTLILSTIKNITSDEGVNVMVRYNALDHISINGAAVLRSDEIVKGDKLEIEMSGAGSVELEVELEMLDLAISGAGAVKLSGAVDEQQIEMSGAGGLDADNLVSRRCKVDISGVGGASIHVTDQLIASVSGVGGVTYQGEPVDVQKSVSGICKISKKE